MVLDLVDRALALRRVLIALADRHRTTVFAAHTHTQPAQPSTIAHYLLAVIEQLERDVTRLRAAFATTNRNPLGACAITGTAFPIDRERTSDAARVRRADREHVRQHRDRRLPAREHRARLRCCSPVWAAWFRICCSGARTSSAICGCRTISCSAAASCRRSAIRSRSSTRARSAARRSGRRAPILLTVHNTPFGDIVDTEDDLQPLVAQMFKDASRAVALVAAAMEHAELDVAKLAERAAQGWITVTELADTLARDHDLPFRAGHEIASRLIAAARAQPGEPLAQVLRTVSKEVVGREIVYDESALATILSPVHFVEVRTTHGGPSPSETQRALAVATETLAADDEWLRTTPRDVGGLCASVEGCGGGALEPASRIPGPAFRPYSVTTECCPSASGRSSRRRSTRPGPYLVRK